MRPAAALTTLLLCAGLRAQEDPRVDALLRQLTLDEKVALIHADGKFSVAGVPRLGIPPLTLSDGPHGVREEMARDRWASQGWTHDLCTYLPTGTALAATWNPDLARHFGKVLGAEARFRGKDVILGPGINLLRTPLGGRTFEYQSEDPCLIARMVAPLVQGIQSQDTAACVKHFALNNQELDRANVDVTVDERTLRELYLPGFEAAVREGGARTVMCAYNRFRGTSCAEHTHLVRDILKGEWGFQGVLMTDWDVKHFTTVGAARAGLDLEMGTDKPFDQYFFAAPLRQAVLDGQVSTAELDEKVRRRLRLQLGLKALDTNRKHGAFNTPEHQRVAREIAAEAMVLMRNEGLLPLPRKGLRRLAVIGQNAVLRHAKGGDSSGIKALFEITPFEGLARKLGGEVALTYTQGYDPSAGGGDDHLLAEAVTAAKAADAVVLVAGQTHAQDTEGRDRTTLTLPGCQDRLISAVLGANPRTVVVLVGGSPVTMPWYDRAPAVVQAWYAGMHGGDALADILFGDVNPSGKLPFTFPKRLEDVGAHALGDYRAEQVTYREGLLVGYRWFDTKAVEPLVPFGHGLSYTTFAYSGLKVAKGPDKTLASVSFRLANTGKRAGAEVAQVYVSGPVGSKVPRPTRELRAFRKVKLAPGQSAPVTLVLTRRDLSFWDEARNTWTLEPGTYTVQVGGSSRDLRLTGTVTLR